MQTYQFHRVLQSPYACNETKIGNGNGIKVFTKHFVRFISSWSMYTQLKVLPEFYLYIREFFTQYRLPSVDSLFLYHYVIIEIRKYGEVNCNNLFICHRHIIKGMRNIDTHDIN